MIIQYVLQTLGFFLQIFPAFLMTFIPFDEESFRYDRKKTVWSVSAALIGVTILFPVLAYLMSGTEQVDINIYTDVYMLILVLGFMGTHGRGAVPGALSAAAAASFAGGRRISAD